MGRRREHGQPDGIQRHRRQDPDHARRKILALGSFANLLQPQGCTRMGAGWSALCHHNAARNVIATSQEVAMTP
jgi:hypothetical protein